MSGGRRISEFERLTQPGNRALPDDDSIPVLTERLALPSLEIDTSLPPSPVPADAEARDETGEPNPAEPNTVFPAATPDVEAVFPARAPDVGDAAGTAEAAESATAEEAGSDEAGPEEAGPEEAIPEEAIARFATSDAADAVGREEAVAAQVADATQSDIPSDAVAAAPPADVPLDWAAIEARARDALLRELQPRLASELDRLLRERLQPTMVRMLLATVTELRPAIEAAVRESVARVVAAEVARQRSRE
jgi:hypothetical protein